MRRELGYYYWVPFCLILQAILFHLPNCLWNRMQKVNGLDIGSLLKMGSEMENQEQCDAIVVEVGIRSLLASFKNYIQ
jgi:hypothetical protein